MTFRALALRQSIQGNQTLFVATARARVATMLSVLTVRVSTFHPSRTRGMTGSQFDKYRNAVLQKKPAYLELLLLGMR